jgi:hypothetical protein
MKWPGGRGLVVKAATSRLISGMVSGIIPVSAGALNGNYARAGDEAYALVR